MCGWQGNYSQGTSKPYYELSKNAIYRAGLLLGWATLAGAAVSYVCVCGGGSGGREYCLSVFVKWSVVLKRPLRAFKTVHIFGANESAGPGEELLDKKRLVLCAAQAGPALCGPEGFSVSVCCGVFGLLRLSFLRLVTFELLSAVPTS